MSRRRVRTGTPNHVQLWPELDGTRPLEHLRLQQQGRRDTRQPSSDQRWPPEPSDQAPDTEQSISPSQSVPPTVRTEPGIGDLAPSLLPFFPMKVLSSALMKSSQSGTNALHPPLDVCGYTERAGLPLVPESVHVALIPDASLPST